MIKNDLIFMLIFLFCAFSLSAMNPPTSDDPCALVDALLVHNARKLSAPKSVDFSMIALSPWKAAKAGHVITLEKLRKAGINLNAPNTKKNKKNFRPIDYAILQGHFNVVAYLLTHDVLVKECGPCGQTPFYLSTIYDHKNTGELLLKHEANINQLNVKGTYKSALGRVLCLPVADESAMEDKLNQINFLLLHGALVNVAMVDLLAPEHTAKNPFRTKSSHIINILLANGLDVNYRNEQGGSVLKEMIEAGIEFVAIAFEKGAKPQADELNLIVNKYESDPQIPIEIPLLLESRSSGAKIDIYHQTPLHLAIATGNHLQMIQILAAKPNLNATDKNRMTPLHYAARKGDLKAAQLLVYLGADCNARNNDRRAPADCVYQNKDNELKEIVANVPDLKNLLSNPKEWVSEHSQDFMWVEKEFPEDWLWIKERHDQLLEEYRERERQLYEKHEQNKQDCAIM